MSNTLTKAAAARQKAADPSSLVAALKNGGPMVWLSCLVMGLANILNGQIIKGLIFLAIEVGVIAFLAIPNGGLYWISMLPSLGWREMEEVWNDDEGVYEYVMGDQSQLILLYGIASLCIIALLVLVWRASVRSGYKAILQNIVKIIKRIMIFLVCIFTSKIFISDFQNPQFYCQIYSTLFV